MFTFLKTSENIKVAVAQVLLGVQGFLNQKSGISLW